MQWINFVDLDFRRTGARNRALRDEPVALHGTEVRGDGLLLSNMASYARVPLAPLPFEGAQLDVRFLLRPGAGRTSLAYGRDSFELFVDRDRSLCCSQRGSNGWSRFRVPTSLVELEKWQRARLQILRGGQLFLGLNEESPWQVETPRGVPRPAEALLIGHNPAFPVEPTPNDILGWIGSAQLLFALPAKLQDWQAASSDGAEHERALVEIAHLLSPSELSPETRAKRIEEARSLSYPKLDEKTRVAWAKHFHSAREKGLFEAFWRRDLERGDLEDFIAALCRSTTIGDRQELRTFVESLAKGELRGPLFKQIASLYPEIYVIYRSLLRGLS